MQNVLFGWYPLNYPLNYGKRDKHCQQNKNLSLLFVILPPVKHQRIWKKEKYDIDINTDIFLKCHMVFIFKMIDMLI